MNSTFNDLSEDSRIWIYQSNKELNNDQVSEISSELNEFLKTWNTHGKPISCSYQVKYNRFIIIAAENTLEISGCSIDSSVAFIQSLEAKYSIVLLDKMDVAYRNNKTIDIISLKDFKQMVKNKSITSTTVVFNNLVSNISELNSNWETTVEDSWHGRFL
ncbi:MAG: ABC transporter ATPase [Bacteroidota bacterium]|nr:ABC transporter ATPase [Bacteroidota bacterium]|tara:strand:- start:265 stop:744 length:480 start_codon:yes stop_codon:yes gene_type:complete